jgi:shikimate dehydrogenase
MAQRRTDRAELAQAVNTLSFDGPEILGDNTDGAGLVRDLTSNLGCELHSRRILLMGAGGAAYGVCGPLLRCNPAELVIANRTVQKAAALCERLKSVKAAATVVRPVSYVELAGQTFDVVINATSAGLADAMPPLPTGVFASGALAYEMVYGKVTPFVEFARREGARAADGLGMLVEQAAESFFVWRGVRPQTASVIEHLRETTEE